jgi:hypothetical protein
MQRLPALLSPQALSQASLGQRSNALRQPGQVYTPPVQQVTPQKVRTSDGKTHDMRRPNGREMRDVRALTRLYTFPTFPVFNAGSAFTSSTQAELQFREPGWIVGFMFEAQNLGTRVARTSLAVALSVVGKGTALTSNSQTLVPIPISLLCPELANGGMDVAPFVRHVQPNDAIYINWQNFNNAGLNITPTGAVLFLPDEDAPPGCRPLPVGSSLPPCSQFVLVPNQATPAAPIAPSSNGPTNGVVTFLANGLVNAFRGDVMMDTGNGRAATAALIESWGGRRDAITTDTAASSFAQLSLLAQGPEMALRLRRRVQIRDEVRCVFQNTDPANSWAPNGVFFLDADDDLTKSSLYE